MSDFVIHMGARKPGFLERQYGARAKELQHAPGSSTTTFLADGRHGRGTCLGCGSAPCMQKDEKELALFGALDTFPGDPSLDVCPTRAITWDHDTKSASIDANDCIGCGLCIKRCPYGAISMTDGLKAHVETDDPDGLLISVPVEQTHPDVKRIGPIAALDAPAALSLPETVGQLDDTRTTLFVRNLFHEIGLNARTRRRGDTNMRIDAVGYSRSERPFVAEIETTMAVLESPRALLEDAAILHSRYGYDLKQIDPLSVILAFPNVRSEYYQVIRDIENVLGLRCRTITIGALIVLLWNHSKLDGFTDYDFAFGAEEIDLTPSLGLGLSHKDEPYPGAFKPAK